MKVAVISDFFNLPGAATAAQIIWKGLQGMGHDARYFIGHRDRNMLSQRDVCWLQDTRALAYKFFNYEEKYRSHIGGRLFNELRAYNPDVVSVHNIHFSRIPVEAIRKISRHYPVVWTVHDPWLFTSHCAVPDDCPKYLSPDCVDCIHPGRYPAGKSQDFPREYGEKKSLVETRSATLVCPSESHVKDALKFCPKAEVMRIPNGVDTSVFSPISKVSARKQLSIPKDERLLVFFSRDVGENWKGLKILKQAVSNLGEGYRLVIIGGGSQYDGFTYTGYIQDKKLLVKHINAADAVVVPSLFDNLPYTLLESLSCGTPVIGFPTGGILDVIEDGVHGIIAKGKTPRNLEEAILEYFSLDEETRLGMCESCRSQAVENYCLPKMLESYLELFKIKKAC